MQQLLERYFLGELAESEKSTLFSAIESDTELKTDFIRLQNIRGLMAVFNRNTVGSEQAETALRWFYAGIRAMRRRRLLQAFYCYAAVIVVAVLCTLVTVRYFVTADDTLHSEIIVPAGQRVNITLSDGTNVCLNSRSKMRISHAFNSGNRKVYLDGEAYFEVAHTESKPFTVETNRYNVRVLGTKFSVINYSEMPMFETSLLEGVAEVSNRNNDETIVLSPNEQVRLIDRGLQKNRIDVANQTSWTNGVLAFDSQSFSEIIKRIELYYDVKFIVQNIKALDIIYTGKFKASDSAEQIIYAIHQANQFNYRMSWDNKIIYIQ